MTEWLESVGKIWLELREPGRVPDSKGPFDASRTAAILRECMDARPSAFITVVTLGDGGPLFQDGPEALQMADGRSVERARRHIESSAQAFASTPAAGEGLEPVAWRGRWSNDSRWHLSRSPRLIHDDNGADYIQEPLYTATPAARAAVLEALLRGIVACTHRPNPTDPTRIDVAPGKHRMFQAAIEQVIAALKEKT